MAENFFDDYPDRIDQIKKYAGIEKLVFPLEEAFGEPGFYKTHSEAVEFYLGALSEMGKLCANEIKPTASQIDREGTKFENGQVRLHPILEQHIKKCVELGIFAGPVHRKNGGLNIPRAVQLVGLEMFGQACPNTGLTIASYSMADFMQKVGSPAQIEKYIPKLLSSEWQTSMALTEPNAGSDLGKLRTIARKRGDQYVVNGTKQFISYGNAHLSFVLARTDPMSTGLSGLSVILVPKEIDGQPNFQVTKIEDKICLHGSPTCELVFENSIGELFGEEGSGFKVMAELMNAARLAMASLAVGLSVAAYEEAKAYAKTRVTMGKPIIQHPMIAEMLCEMELEIQGMRALIVEAALAFDWMNIAKLRGDEKEFKRWRKRYRRLTPLCKYMTSEKTITITRNALQILGGYGVCRDYPVERFVRESLIYPIYEGTSQIQSLMVLKDSLKDVASQSAGFLGSLAGAWAESMVTVNPVKSKLLQARNELNQALRTILLSIIRNKFKSDIEDLRQQKIQEFIKDFSLNLLTTKTDLTLPFLWAERLTRITCDYYALKCMADHLSPGDEKREKQILDYAEILLPRMQLENQYMAQRATSTLDYMKQFID